MTPFLTNAWYLAAYDREIAPACLFPRTILDEPIVFYRDSSNTVSALGDICPHRFASLHLGELKGDVVQCAYHGLQFARDGSCSFNPHGSGKIPATARIRAYPVHVKHDRVWIWMGDPARSDVSAVPELPHLDDPRLATIEGKIDIDAHYEVPLDNLMDLSHTQFIHKEFLASDYLRGTQHVTEENGAVVVSVWVPNTPAPPNFRRAMPDPDARVDHWIETRWLAPATVLINFGTTGVGRSRAEGMWSIGTHIVTPATESSSHYFYANSRSFALNDPAIDAQRRDFQERAFGQQDKPIIENAFRNMKTPDLFSLSPVLLASDAGAIQVRRRLARLISEEARSPEVVRN